VYERVGNSCGILVGIPERKIKFGRHRNVGR
jgi:hypothetical protein